MEQRTPPPLYGLCGVSLKEQLEGGGIDIVTFISSSTVRNLVEMLGDDAAVLLEGVTLAAMS